MQTTEERILSASLLLFNEKGLSQTSTNNIAKYLDISPGNVYYYFNNKSDIIMKLFSRYEEKLHLLLSPSCKDYIKDINQLSYYLDNIFPLMWEYRFFYINLTEIIKQNSLMKSKYLLAKIEINKSIEVILDNCESNGWLNIANKDKILFIEHLNFLSTLWINYELMLNNDNYNIVNRGIIRFLNSFSLISTEQGKLIIKKLMTRYE
jgi:hypothetical protein